MASPEEKLQLAKEHLERVQGAWEPPDWAPLSLFGFYCLEAAVDAAALHVGIDLKASHWRRVDAAERLHAEHALPEIAELLEDLNATRKSEVYGDVPAPDLDAEDVVGAIEAYVDAVEELLAEREEEEAP